MNVNEREYGKTIEHHTKNSSQHFVPNAMTLMASLTIFITIFKYEITI